MGKKEFEKDDGECSETQKPKDVDKEVRDGNWLVVLAGFVMYFCSSGISSVFGLLYIELERETGSEILTLSWIGSLFIGFSLDSAPFVGIIARYWSYWSLAVVGGLLSSIGYFLGFISTSLPVLYLGLGVLSGLGFGISTFATVVVIGHTFTRRRPLALGVCTAGVGAGMIVFPPVYTLLLEMYGLRGLFLITAGLFLNNAVLGIFLRSSQRDVQQPTQTVMEGIINPKLVKSGKFAIFLLFNFLYIFAFSVPFTYIPLRATELGISLPLTALLVSISGVTSMTGRVLIGMIAGNLPRARPWLLLLFISLSGIVMNVVPFAQSYVTLAFLGAVFMLFTGAANSLVPVLVVDMFGTDLLACSLGLIYFIYGIGSMLGVPVVALVCEAAGDNQWAFHVAGFCLYVSSALVVVCNRMKTPEGFFQTNDNVKKIPDVESNMEAIDISVIDLPEPVGTPAA